MEQKKRELSKLVHELKKQGLTQKQLVNIYRTPDLFKQLLYNSNKSINKLKCNVWGSSQNFDQNYKDKYKKFTAVQTSALAKELKVSVKFLQEILDIEIKKQR